MSTVGIVTDSNIGGNFLAWTLHRLSGNLKYYLVEQTQEIEVCANPINDVNSHGFQSNHPNNLEHVEPVLKALSQQSQLQHIYIHKLRNNDNSIIDRNSQTKQGIDLIKQYCEKVIVISKPTSYSLYDVSLQRRSKILVSNDGSKLIDSDNDALNDFLDYFFKENKSKWPNTNSMSVWDKREFIALVIRPFDSDRITNYHQFDFDHFALSAPDLWLNLGHSIHDVLNYCDLDLDCNLYDSWKPVYYQWQQLHLDRLKFCWYFDTIVDNIVSGRHMDLSRFNLDIVREAAIQHVLIYKHNLNLKTWQLEKFENTQQLHKLLEPNTHPIKQ